MNRKKILEKFKENDLKFKDVEYELENNELKPSIKRKLCKEREELNKEYKKLFGVERYSAIDIDTLFKLVWKAMEYKK